MASEKNCVPHPESGQSINHLSKRMRGNWLNAAPDAQASVSPFAITFRYGPMEGSDYRRRFKKD